MQYLPITEADKYKNLLTWSQLRAVQYLYFHHKIKPTYTIEKLLPQLIAPQLEGYEDIFFAMADMQIIDHPEKEKKDLFFEAIEAVEKRKETIKSTDFRAYNLRELAKGITAAEFEKMVSTDI